jgi:hypothetical protein
MMNILPAKTNLHRSGVNQTRGSPIKKLKSLGFNVTITAANAA